MYTMQNNIENMLDRTRLVSLHMMLPVTAVILLLSGIVVDAAWPPMMAKPGCQEKCGNVTIPYPFGMGSSSCYYTEWYSITCDNFTPTLSKFGLQVLNISLVLKTVQVYSPFSFNCTSVNSTWTSTDFSRSPYKFSTHNAFASVHSPGTSFNNGGDKLVAQCGSVCDFNSKYITYMGPTDTEESVCLTYPSYPLIVYSVNFTRNSNSSTCSYVFLVDGNYLDSLNLSQPQSVWSIGRNGTHIPVVLDWVYQLSSENANPNCAINEVGTYDYTCACPQGQGLAGNPYLPNGCQRFPLCDCKGQCFVTGEDYTHIECRESWMTPLSLGVTIGRLVILRLIVGIGSLFFAFGGYWLRRFFKRRKENKQRAQNFKHNGGLLLQQQISSTEGVVEKAKLFTVGELEVATDHFNQNRILGQGGQGTVYRGILADGKIIAVKKSEKVDKAQLAPFINEVVILSQINHRNVVKLLGCCLETNVPLLVYEFIPNGTLSQHIHNPSEDFHISWPMRLQIASESAGAIAYLHSSCSAPIYHRDIKSSNILLDEKFQAKVSDFGISRTIKIDQTHLTTQVAGTFGYFDPEYFLSTQFTDKSDVYSFGVVLVELLTSRTPIFAISADEIKEWRSLSSDFLSVMENSQLLDILDGQILEEGKMEEFLTVANLAKECLNTCGKQRPTMKQVATVLEGLRSENGDSSTQPTFSELNQMNADLTEIEMVPSISSTFSSRRDYLFLDTV